MRSCGSLSLSVLVFASLVARAEEPTSRVPRPSIPFPVRPTTTPPSGTSWQVWVLDVGTGEKQFIAHGMPPLWSPDGSLLALEACEPDGRDLGVSVWDGSRTRVITKTVVRPTDFAWSKDGDELIVANVQLDGERGAQTARIPVEDPSRREPMPEVIFFRGSGGGGELCIGPWGQRYRRHSPTMPSPAQQQEANRAHTAEVQELLAAMGVEPAKADRLVAQLERALATDEHEEDKWLEEFEALGALFADYLDQGILTAEQVDALQNAGRDRQPTLVGWSQEGNPIVVRQIAPEAPDWARRYSLVVQHDDGNDLQVLCDLPLSPADLNHSPGLLHRIDCSPDLSHVALVVKETAGQTDLGGGPELPASVIKILSVATGAEVVVGPGEHPSWSPDGKWLLFAAPPPAGWRGPGPPKQRLCLCDPQGEQQRVIALGQISGWRSMSWSPDSRLVGYSTSPITPYDLMGSPGDLAELLDRGQDPDARDEEGRTLLHIAAECGETEAGRLLLDRGADINAQDRFGSTPLHKAASMGQAAFAALLLKQGADVDRPAKDGSTPLYWAAERAHRETVAAHRGHKEMPDLLIAHGAKVTIHIAAALGDVDRARELLNQGSDPNEAVREGRDTPLWLAVYNDHTEVVKLLLERGADPNIPTGWGLPVLLEAARPGATEMVALLLEHGADPRAADADGNTALHIAAQGAAEPGRLDLVELLLRSDADPNAKGFNGLRPLHCAQSPEMLRVLLEHGAAPDLRDAAGETPLHEAARRSSGELVRVLLEHGADPNLKSRDGLTPLHVAADWGSVEIATMLLKHEASVDSRSPAGTPLHCAAHGGHSELVRLLLSRGADPNLRDEFGRTPLHRSAIRGDREITELLLQNQAQANARDDEGLTPLAAALAVGEKAVVDVLGAHGGRR